MSQRKGADGKLALQAHRYLKLLISILNALRNLNTLVDEGPVSFLLLTACLAMHFDSACGWETGWLFTVCQVMHLCIWSQSWALRMSAASDWWLHNMTRRRKHCGAVNSSLLVVSRNGIRIEASGRTSVMWTDRCLQLQFYSLGVPEIKIFSWYLLPSHDGKEVICL